MPKPNTDTIKKMYKDAFTIRWFEEKVSEQYRVGNIRGFVHPYVGEEAIAVATISACRLDDYITAHRSEYDSGKVDKAVKEAIKQAVFAWINIIGSAGKA